MIPILYDSRETAFSSNGLGALSDCPGCWIDREVNGGFELELQYSTQGIHFDDIRVNRIILAKMDGLERLQPFRIYRIGREIGLTVRIYARHIAYDLMGIPVGPFAAESAAAAMAAIRDKAVVDFPFVLEAEVDSQGSMENDSPKDAWTLLGKNGGGILSAYPGELEFDRNRITLKQRLGQERQAVLRYGVNLRSFQQEENIGEVYTGIYPFWGKNDAFVTLPEGVVNAKGSFEHVKIKPVDFSQVFEAAPEEAQLREKAEQYILENGIGVPEVAITASFVQLCDTLEYSGAAPEEIHLGDTIGVCFQDMGISTRARVVKTRYNVLKERHETISIGAVKRTISDTIKKHGNTSSSAYGLAQVAGTEAKKALYDTNQCIAEIEGVKGGLYAVVSKDELELLKQSSTTMYADVSSAKAGIDLIATEDVRERLKEAKTTLYAEIPEKARAEIELYVVEADGEAKTLAKILADQISLTSRVGNAESALTLKADSDTVEALDGRVETVETAQTELVARVDGAEAILEQKAESKTVQSLSGRVSTVETAQNSLTARVGSAESSLEQKAEKKTVEALDGRVETVETAQTGLSARVDGAEASIDLNAQNINGVASSVADIEADVIKLQGDTEILGNLTIVDGNLKSTRGIVSDNGITGSSIYANGTGSQGIISGRRVSCSEISVGGKEYTEKEITSTSGTVRVLGIA